jgi:hypothetical protein
MRMHILKVIVAAGLLFHLLGCRTPIRNTWLAGGLKDDYTADCKHLFVACIYEDYWEDKGSGRLAPHHIKATVVRTFKGDWKFSERVAFVHYVDTKASTVTNAAAGGLIFIATSQHKDAEIILDAGEFGNCDADLERELERANPQRSDR